MGLLDSLLGSMMGGGLPGGQQGAGTGGGMGGLGGAAGGMSGAAIAAIVLQLLQQNGGLQGLLRSMQQTGYGNEAQSWIGSGQNMPISPDALSQIFGQGNLQQIAGQLGMSHEDASSALAHALPQVVNHMTPDGGIPDGDDDLVARTLRELQGRR